METEKISTNQSYRKLKILASFEHCSPNSNYEVRRTEVLSYENPAAECLLEFKFGSRWNFRKLKSLFKEM